MTIRLTYCDTRLTSVDELAAMRAGGARGLELVVLQSVGRHPLWRNTHAHAARTLELLVAGGGAPAAGTLLLSSLAVDVMRSDAIALATPPDRRRRTAVAITVAPHGRADERRLVVIGTDLTDEEWQAHRDELRERLSALGHPSDAAVLLLAVDYKLLRLPALGRPDEAARIEPTGREGAALVFEVDC